MKTKLLLLLLAVFTISTNAQTFDWETGVLLSFGSSNQNIIAKQIVGSYEVNFSATGTSTPILLGNFGQGTTGKAVMNQQPQQVVRLSFFPAVDIQSLKAFSADASSTNWTFTPVNSSGNAVVTANVAQNAVTVNLNWTNVSIIDITLTNGGSQNFGVDDIVFTPYVPCTVSIPDANFKAALVADGAINTNGNTEIECSEANAFAGTIVVFNDGIFDLIGIEAFTNITGLNCGNNNLSNIDVSANTALTTLACSFNSLASLDVSNNIALEDLSCINNQITSLDVSSNTSLTALSCNNNFLAELNVANGNNMALTSFSATSNAALSCIQIDAGFTPPAAWGKDATASYSDDCSAPPCTVTIPDANFKAYLVGNTAINTNGDTEIQCSEASAFTGAINVANQSIADLTGIEAFVALTELYCADNSLSTLDVTNNTSLTALQCQNNLLTSIDVSNNISLFYLDIKNNSISSLDVSNNVSLEIFYCNNNTLSSLDVSNNLSITMFYCENNSLTSLDVSNNTSLENLYCQNNSISSLDVSNHTSLVQLLCYDNSISTLSVSNSTSLNQLLCYSNSLSSLNLANGNNSSLAGFVAVSNPDLTCIQIDAGFTPPANWQTDTTVSYSDDCAALSVNDFNLNSISLHPNPTNSMLNIEMDHAFKQATIYSVLGKEVLKTQHKTIEVSGLSKGLFLIKIENESGNVLTKRFIKE